MKMAIFLDRDGTIVEEVNYLSRIEDMVLIEGAARALRSLKEEGFFLVVVTNQAGVARGYFDARTVMELNAELNRWLEKEGAQIDAFYYCPHHPDFGAPCDCRKPSPGMVELAAREHSIDLENSWVVGDKLSDVGAGARAGCKTALVLTGYGKKELLRCEEKGLRPDIVADSLAQFAQKIKMSAESR